LNPDHELDQELFLMHTRKALRIPAAYVAFLAGLVTASPAAPVHGQEAPACAAAICVSLVAAPALEAPASLAPGGAPGAAALHGGAAPAISLAAATAMQGGRSRRWEGAAIGFAAGAAITWYTLYQGGSTGPCNRRENQDAWSAQHCVMAAAAGGLVLAPVGYFIGSRIGGGR
jgi:hypothetical protein